MNIFPVPTQTSTTLLLMVSSICGLLAPGEVTASSPENYCASGIKTQIFQQFDDSDLALTRHQVYDDPVAPSGIKAKFGLLESYKYSPCHIQGLAWFESAANGAKFTFDWNSFGGESEVPLIGEDCPDPESHVGEQSGILMTATENPGAMVDEFTAFGSNPEAWHPGGMQAIGDHVVVGIDAGGNESSIYVWDYSLPADPLCVAKIDNPYTRAEAVAMAKRPDNGHYVLMVGANQGRTITIFESAADSIEYRGCESASTQWEFQGSFTNTSPPYYVGPLKKSYNYNNLALLRECEESDALYLVGLTANGSGYLPDEDDLVIELFRVTLPEYRFSRIGSKKIKNSCGFLDTCPNFSAGGTIVARADGGLSAFATEHWPEGDPKDLDIRSLVENAAEDTEAPVVFFAGPRYQRSGSTVSLYLHAEDAGQRPARVEIEFDGPIPERISDAQWWCPDEVDRSDYCHIYGWIPPANGTYTVTAWAGDTTGNWGQDSFVLEVDWIGEYEPDVTIEETEINYYASLRKYSGVGLEDLKGSGVAFTTDISTRDEICGVVGLAAYDGDILESRPYIPLQIMEARVEQYHDKWQIRAEFLTHNDQERWEITLLCIKTTHAAFGRPALFDDPGAPPFFFESFSTVEEDINVNTGIPIQEYVCGVVGMAVRNPLGISHAGSGDILKVYLEPSEDEGPSGDTWLIVGDIRTRYPYLDQWRVDLICANANITSLDGPQADKEVFLKDFRDLGDDNTGSNTHNTGLATEEYACGIVGMAARNGDIREDGGGSIVQAFLEPKGDGFWHIWADFRTHENVLGTSGHETWDITMLCFELQDASCSPPDSGEWLVSADCTLIGPVSAPGNVIIEDNRSLAIGPGSSLDIDFSEHHLRIREGARVVIKSGGKVW